MAPRYLENVVTLRYNAEACIGCGRCLEVCPHAVFTMRSDNKAAMQDRDACMECGACARNCPSGAITVQAGVGCAYGIINGWMRGKLGMGSGAACC